MLAPGGRLHVMEGVIKEERDGHWLTPGGAESLAARCLGLGYAEAKIDTVKTGWRHQYYVVTAVAPG